MTELTDQAFALWEEEQEEIEDMLIVNWRKHIDKFCLEVKTP